MTEDEKTAIKTFIDSMHPVSSDQWKERALKAEKLLNDLKNTINIGKGIQCSVSNMHDNVAKLVFRWNETPDSRIIKLNAELTEYKKYFLNLSEEFVRKSL